MADGILGTRVFTHEDQSEFARLSGDRNPMHMDKIAARRTQAGAPVVHGMHAVLWALDLIAKQDPSLAMSGLSIHFGKFMYLDHTIDLRLLERNAKAVKFEVMTQGQNAVSGSISLSPDGLKASDSRIAPNAPEISALNLSEPSFEELEKLRGRFSDIECDGLDRLFPNAAKAITPRRLGALAQLSTLVGMVCPGLHSIFGGLRVEFVNDAAEPAGLEFCVASTDPRFRLVRMDVGGSGIAGKVSAFSRVPPVEAPPMTELAKFVNPSEFADGTALILGGSRGLGAVTAKLLALGGSKSIVTYALGHQDALKLAAEINATRGPGFCTTLPLDMREDVRAQLTPLRETVTHFYHFATPPIQPQKEGAFAPDVYASFSRFYLSSFFEAVQFLLSQVRPGDLSVFYPSSAYAGTDTRPSGLTEYGMVKMAGELLCADLNRSNQHLRIHIERLPRVLTDQTASVTASDTADPVSVMLPVIRKVFGSNNASRHEGKD